MLAASVGLEKPCAGGSWGLFTQPGSSKLEVRLHSAGVPAAQYLDEGIPAPELLPSGKLGPNQPSFSAVLPTD